MKKCLECGLIYKYKIGKCPKCNAEKFQKYEEITDKVFRNHIWFYYILIVIAPMQLWFYLSKLVNFITEVKMSIYYYDISKKRGVWDFINDISKERYADAKFELKNIIIFEKILIVVLILFVIGVILFQLCNIISSKKFHISSAIFIIIGVLNYLILNILMKELFFGKLEISEIIYGRIYGVVLFISFFVQIIVNRNVE